MILFLVYPQTTKQLVSLEEIVKASGRSTPDPDFNEWQSTGKHEGVGERLVAGGPPAQMDNDDVMWRVIGMAGIIKKIVVRVRVKVGMSALKTICHLSVRPSAQSVHPGNCHVRKTLGKLLKLLKTKATHYPTLLTKNKIQTKTTVLTLPSTLAHGYLTIPARSTGPLCAHALSLIGSVVPGHRSPVWGPKASRKALRHVRTQCRRLTSPPCGVT